MAGETKTLIDGHLRDLQPKKAKQNLVKAQKLANNFGWK